MTPEQQRIAIAEACGWKGISHEHLTGYAPWRPTPYIERVMGDLDSIPLDLLPDYLNDLNAMHEAEKILTPEQHELYRRTQFEIATGVSVKVISHLDKQTKRELFYQAAMAPCHTGSEAFLRTLNLYTQ